MNKTNRFILTFFLAFSCLALFSQVTRQSTSAVITNVPDKDIFYHIIEPGQTVYSIATQYGVSVDEIHRLNPGSEQVIRAGDKLKVPQKEKASYLFHDIEAKETLYSLSKKYDVPATSILEANQGLSVATFQIGKTIRIPVAAIEELPQQTDTQQTSVKEIEYKVEKKETMYRLTRKFNISQEKLLAHNPELKKGVKAGMIIKIPVETKETVTQNVPEAKERDVNALLSKKQEIEKVSKVKIALLLPFMSGNVTKTEQAERCVEYYEGLLLAVDSMKSKGVSVELVVRDTEEGTAKLNSVLKESALQGVNLIIGGVENDQIGLLAEYAKKNEVRYVIPFTSKNDDVLSNAYVYQINTPHSYLYAGAAQIGYDMFSNDNIIFVDTYDKDDKADFIKAFKLLLSQKGIVFRDLVYRGESFGNDMLNLLSADKRNIVVPLSGTIEALNKIRTPLRTIVDTKPQFRINLFGYPEWQTYTRDCLDDFFALNTYIYSNFYADNVSGDVLRFNMKYKSWFSKNPINTFPRYSMLGFDSGMFFLGAVNRYGANFENNLDKVKYKSLQTGFRFHRVNNWGGFVNTNLFLVQYSKQNFSVVRQEIK